MTNYIARGRQVVAYLTNQSGGGVIAGDVVIVSAANDESFTTTTSAAYNSTRVGVAQESIAAAAVGRILLEGYAPLVNVSASATRGHYLLTHTVAKQATSQAGYAAGAFGQILKAGTTPSAMIFPVAQVGSAGVARSGATTDAHLAVWNGSNADSLKDGGVAPAASAMVLLGNSTLGGDAATVSVDSIPSGYRALKIIAWLRGTQAATSIWCNGLLNDDSGANYDLMQLAALSSTVSATTQNAASSFSVGTIPAASATAGMFAQVEITIAEYAGSARKVLKIDNVATYGTSNETILNINSCAWRSTAAITKVTFITAANFLAGSKMAVYGIT